MNSVFFSIALSLDGYMVPKDMDFAHADNVAEQPWFRQWSALTQWIFRQRYFREMLRIGEGGETGRDNALLESVFARTGASIMGKRMFDGGERSWPEEAPFHTAVFVVTHEVRDPWIRPGRLRSGSNARSCSAVRSLRSDGCSPPAARSWRGCSSRGPISPSRPTAHRPRAWSRRSR